MIADILLCPTDEYAVQSGAFRAAEFSVFEVSIVNHFGNRTDPSIANAKFFAQSFESAIIPAMTKAAVLEHIEGNCFGVFVRIAVENKLGIPVDEAGDQPG